MRQTRGKDQPIAIAGWSFALKECPQARAALKPGLSRHLPARFIDTRPHLRPC